MKRGIERLTPLKISRASRPGLYCDGGGLYLQLGVKGGKCWVFRYLMNGKDRRMGLGALHTVSVEEARDGAKQARRWLREGVDPLEQKEKEVSRTRVKKLHNPSFDECAKLYIEAHEAGWKNKKHRQQWENTLRIHASPVIGNLSVSNVDTQLVLSVLDPIWREKTETASRLRERIERILAWATIRGYRSGENPARWRGHLDEMLPKPAKLKKTCHHSALPYSDVNLFVERLKRQSGLAAKSLMFTILTACRTNEVLGAQWNEIDFEKKVWVIPSERMKGNRVHRVPLSEETLTILEDLKGLDPVLVFPGAKSGKPLSNMAMLTLLKRMDRGDITVHGFRSTFRDWAAESTDYSREVVEMALAHTVGDSVENAYRRTDLYERRRRLMSDWASICCRSATLDPMGRCELRGELESRTDA